MLENPFLLTIYPRTSKKLKFTLICSDDQKGFVTPSDHCAGYFPKDFGSNFQRVSFCKASALNADR